MPDETQVDNASDGPTALADMSPKSPLPTQPDRTVVASNLETANLIEGYHVIAEWIRFADAKAAVVLTVGGAVAGLVIPTLRSYLGEENAVHPTSWWTTMVGCLFAIWLLLLLLSGIFAFRCILPYRRKGQHPALGHCSHFHPAAISVAFKLDDADRFIAECESMGDGGLRKEVAACLLIDSHISGAKYRHVTTSIRLIGISSIIALIYLVAIQF
ncbi:hypothetical protein [Stieleria varia]|uniref:Pycsar effector protein domain-containing protein n=1 Tax=Stieleria varia TaxID=2528005 RepID=A0A5C6AVC3_9BACT|nr:hypothetical protein [Stieleria varia]TWU02996.1 hypothetical protein Pla52n_40850 [Stieleria varia]